MEELKKKSRKGCLGKIRNCFGVRDVYKLIRKNHWFDIGQTVSEKDYYAIIRGVNNLLADNLAHGIPVDFPSSMGRLELCKHTSGVTIKDGIMTNTYPINWGATWKLWREDEEAHKMKTLVFYENEWTYVTKYNKWNATYENKQFYLFILNRKVRKVLADNIKAGDADTLWLSDQRSLLRTK